LSSLISVLAECANNYYTSQPNKLLPADFTQHIEQQGRPEEQRNGGEGKTGAYRGWRTVSSRKAAGSKTARSVKTCMGSA
jgi:hypothetical protein